MPGRMKQCCIAIALVSLSATAAPRRRAVPSVGPHFCDVGADVAGITVPAEFCVRKFADVPTPRVLLFAPNGDLFVSSPKRITPGGAPPGPGAIFLYRGANPDKRTTYAEGDTFQTVHGILIANGSFYFTTVDTVYSVPYDAGAAAMDKNLTTAVAFFAIQSGFARFTHALAASSDGSIYTTFGQMDNSDCLTGNNDGRLGAVLRIGAGHNAYGDIVTRGLRNPLFIRCMPWSTCYAAELSGDSWEAVGGTEKLIEIHDGETYGYPCCVQRGVPNPEIPPRSNCADLADPKLAFPLHNTPFGFDWERDFGWPAQYKGGFFVGLHGDYANWNHAGVQWAPTDPMTHLPAQPTSDFLTGVGRGKTISRVGDLRFAPDGRLFFADDQGGAIYWIAPRTLNRPPAR
jgi:glucose/arabinose dehydrogenase